MISKVSIQNFKCLVTLHPARAIYVFVGPTPRANPASCKGWNCSVRSFVGQEGSLEGILSQAASRGSIDSVELAGESGGKGYRYRTGSPSLTPRIGQAWSGKDAVLHRISIRLIGSVGLPISPMRHHRLVLGAVGILGVEGVSDQPDKSPLPLTFYCDWRLPSLRSQTPLLMTQPICAGRVGNSLCVGEHGA